MLKRILPVAAALVFVGAPLMAQEHGAHPQGRDATVTGQVIDLSCKVASGASGQGHVACAKACAQGGIPLAIQTADGNIYIPLADQPGKGVNDRLVNFAEQRVTVEGTVFEQGGVRGIKMRTIRAAT
jgi:hypothetical protein